VEVRINAVLGGLLVLAWAALTVTEPVCTLDPSGRATHQLAGLENDLARDPGNVEVAQSLAEAYLLVGRPRLVIAALRSPELDLRQAPMLAHRLAQAYEDVGRFEDALATAELALARCARSLGSSRAGVVTSVPAFGCTARDHVVLETHRSALDHMVRLGVEDPSDPRARLAYERALRRASIASAR